MPSPIQALLDANVLYSNHLRNLLLQLAQNEVFIVVDADRGRVAAERGTADTRSYRARALPLIRDYFPSALVSVPAPDCVVGGTDPKDRHVASAAIELAPCILVTSNERHFDAGALAALGVKVQSPDDFLTERFVENPDFVEAATREAAANLTRTAPSWEDYLVILKERQLLPKFVACLHGWRARHDEA